MHITIDEVRFNGFSFQYKVGLSLITYQFDGETEWLYCESNVSNRDILECIRKRTDGLNHCVRTVQRWEASGMICIIPDTGNYLL